jgi:hypothetical protein
MICIVVAITTIILMAPIFVLGQGELHQPERGWKKVGEVSVDTLTAGAYSRALVSDKIGNLRLGGGAVLSEGIGLRQVNLGWVWEPGKKQDREFFVEGFAGIATLKQGTRPVFGERFLYLSEDWMFESWVSQYPGLKSWTNCEPLFDAMRGVGKGIYAGVATSCYVGFATHGHHGKHREWHFLGGPAVLWRIERWRVDVGTSLETRLPTGGKKYIGVFVTYTLK